MNIGQNILNLRKSANLSQEQLAEKMGVTRQTISNWGIVGKIINVTADEEILKDDKVDISLLEAIAFDPYTHGYYKVTDRVGNAFKDGLQLK